jgi:hypothetical protein
MMSEGAGARWRRLGVVLGAAAVIPAACGIAAARESSSVPAPLVGKWTRTITKADWQRSAGGLILAAGKLATLTIAKNGQWRAVIQGLGGLGTVDGTVVAAGAGRVHFNTSGESPSLYAWRVSGPVLTLTKVTDATADRRLFFVGTWKRK